MKTLPLTQGKVALVDDGDYEWLMQYKWCASREGTAFYARGLVDGRQTSMHRLIANTPTGLFTDHRDGNGLNNCRGNLRVCTPMQNQHNRTVQAGSSRFKGVQWHSLSRKWMARIAVNKHRVYLGLFRDEVEAAQAYDNAALTLHKEFARMNLAKPLTAAK